MTLSQPATALNILVLHGPELARAGLDPQNFCQELAELPHCRVLPVSAALPLEQQQELVRGFLTRDPQPAPVVLATQEPEHRAAAVARLLLEELGLHPEHLEQVDLAAALEQPDAGYRRAKGMELIRQAASRVRGAVPLALRPVPVSRQVLIWGDSFAALRLALEVADLRYPVLVASPHPEPSPLAFEYGLGMTGAEALRGLLQRVQEHPLIQTVYEAMLRDLAGVAGSFQVKLATPQGQVVETVGAIVLAPEVERRDGPGCQGAPEHPGVISQSRLEALVAQPPDRGLPTSVALMVGLAGESHPLSLNRALKAASRLLAAGSQVYLLVGNAKLGGKGTAQALQAAQEQGLLLIKLKDCPVCTAAAEGLRLSFFEPSLRQELALSVDLVVYEDQYRAAPENARLAELLRLPLGRRGFLQDDNVHHIPVATSRRGILVVGPGRGVMDLEDTEADVNAAVWEIQSLLGQGEALAPLGRAVVDRGKCVLCLTCHRYCPHGAITWDSRAIINELACQGCGICASQCPNDAIQVRNFTDEQVAAQLAALDPDLHPRVVAFLCRNSSWEAYQATVRLHAASLPVGFTAVKLPCAGKVDPEYLLQAFHAGADGVMVLSCPQDNCKSTHGNRCAAHSVEQVQHLLAEIGIEPHRLLFHSLAANAPGDFIEAVDHFLADLTAPAAVPDEAHPLRLAIGTTYSQPAAGLTRRAARPGEAMELVIELSPADAERLGIRPGEPVTVAGPQESLTATAVLSQRIRPGTAFLPSSLKPEAVRRLAAGAPEIPVRLPEYRALAVYLAKKLEEFEEIFGLKVPTSRFLHRGHTWVALESGGRVRLGMDDFSQKLLGRGDALRLPLVGEEVRREQKALALYRGSKAAPVLAPVYGVVERVNQKVVQRPGLVHDDPYGDGWLLEVAATELEPDLGRLISGPDSPSFMEEEAMRLVAMLEPSVGATLQSGGGLIDDIYGQFPDLGWERLVKEFLRTS